MSIIAPLQSRNRRLTFFWLAAKPHTFQDAILTDFSVREGKLIAVGSTLLVG